MRLALSPLLCVLSASLVLAACGGSDGGGSNPTNVALDESAVTTMEEGLTYELVPDGGATVGNSVQSWRWSAQPIVEGALSQCAAVEQFDLERAATSLETACTVPGKCTLTFDQVSSPDVQGSGQSRFSVRIPVLKADVGVTYRLEAVDTTGQTSVGNFTFCLLAVNERPTAGDDAFTVTEGTPLVVSGDSGINLLTNDTDDIYVGNQPLSVTSTPVVAPTVATSFALQPDGGFSYLYEGDAVVAGGTQIRDSFQYEISDGTFNAIATVNLTIVAVDNPPQLTGDLPDLNVVAGVPVEVDYSGFFADPEQGDLFFTAIGLPASGQLTLSPLGVLTGMATQADVGSYQVQIQADDQQNSAVGLFNLVVAGNQPPTTQPIPDQVVAFGELVSIETADYFTDPEGVALTFALESQPPSDLQINPDTGLISGLITNPGQYQLTVVVDDAAGNLVSLSFQLTQQERPNQAPVFTGQISSQTVTVGSGINPVSGEFSDPDNDTLTYSINNTATGLSFNPVTGVLSGEPADLGITSFVITAEDPEGLSVSSNPFQITVTAIPNGAPVFSGNISNQTGRVGELITPISGNFSDPDDDALTFTSTTLPPGLILNAAGVINGTPSAPGTSDVTITATDTEGASVSSNEFSIIILPPIDNPPVITGTQPASISVQAGDNVGFQVNVTDEDESSLGYTAVSVNPAVATVAGGTNGAFTVNGISEGSTSVTITVTDGAGQSGSTSISVTVSALPNEPPEITGRLPAGNLTLDPGDEQTFSITVDDEDPSSLVYSSSVTNTLVATVATNANDTFTVTAVGEGQATVTFQIEDDGNLTDSVSFTVTVTALPDDPPVIDSRTPPGSISMEPGDSTVVTLDVTDEDEASLAYDADSDDTDVVTVSVNPDNSITFNAVGDGSTTVTLTVTDGAGQQDSVVVPVIVDTGNLAPVIDSRIPAGNSTLEPGDTLDVSLNVSDESFATLVFDADSDDTDVATVSVGSGGDFTVLAIADGVAVITFSVEDEEGLTDTDTMTITVDTGNQAPQITATDPGTSIGLLDGEVETVTLTVTDEDLPSVIYTAVSDDTAIASVTVGTDGEFDVTAEGPGETEITLTAADSDGLSDSVVLTVTVSAANAAPEIDDRTPSGTIELESGESTNVSLSITDEDLSSLLYDASSDAPAVATATALGDGSYSIDAGISGSATLTLTVTDSEGLFDTELVDVEVNAPPTIDSRDPATDLLMATSSTETVSLTVTDESESTLVFTGESGTESVVLVTNTDNIYTLESLLPGQSTITFTVTDEKGLSDTDSMLITVDDPPVIVSRNPSGVLDVPEGGSVLVSLDITDENLASIDVQAVSLDSLVASVVVTTDNEVEVLGLAEGNTTVTIDVIDEYDQSDSVTIPVDVTAALLATADTGNGETVVSSTDTTLESRLTEN